MNKIITQLQEFPCQGRHSEFKDGREWNRYVIEGKYEDIVKAFDGKPYSHEWDSLSDGKPIIESRNLSEFLIMGDIIDKRDGTFWVYMGKPNDKEIIAEKDAKIAELTATVAEKEAEFAEFKAIPADDKVMAEI